MTGRAGEPDGGGAPPPAVTVVIATYNRSETLALALRSVLAQDLADFEVRVVGDGCTDDSEAVVRALGDPRVHWHGRAEHTGSQARPNDEGLARARGRHVAYLGHDDLWLPWHLSTLVRRLEETGADCASALAALIGPDGVRFPSAVIPLRGGGADWYAGPPSCCMHRRAVALDAGGWPDPDRIATAVDNAFWNRLHAHGARFALAPRLTTLKFPSLMFRTSYATHDASAQASWWARVQADPAAAEHELLTALAVAATFERPTIVPREVPALGRALVVVAARACVRRLPGLWNSGPLVRLRVWRYQRLRRAIRRRRGLPVR